MNDTERLIARINVHLSDICSGWMADYEMEEVRDHMQTLQRECDEARDALANRPAERIAHGMAYDLMKRERDEALCGLDMPADGAKDVYTKVRENNPYADMRAVPNQWVLNERAITSTINEENERLRTAIENAPHEEECAAYVAYLQDLLRWQEGPQAIGTAPDFDDYTHACDCFKHEVLGKAMSEIENEDAMSIIAELVTSRRKAIRERDEAWANRDWHERKHTAFRLEADSERREVMRLRAAIEEALEYPAGQADDGYEIQLILREGLEKHG